MENEMKPSTGNTFLVLAFIVVVILVGYYAFTKMGKDGTEDSNTAVVSQMEPTQVVEEEQAIVDEQAPEVKFTVNASNYKYDLTTIKVKQGDKVIIEVQNLDGFHDFKLDEFNTATKVLKVGESETVEFVADQKGEFEYYCSVGEHRAMGMVGTLTVE
jgi:plastocyanin